MVIVAPDAVRLSLHDHCWLAWVGERRWESRRNSDRGLGPSRQLSAALINHTRGAKTEFSASVILNLYWQPLVLDSELGEHLDVGGLVEARSTELPNGRLIVKSPETEKKRGVPFVLIKIEGSIYRALGWVFAEDAKRFPLLTEFGDPAHFVPQMALRKLDALRDWLQWRRKHDTAAATVPAQRTDQHRGAPPRTQVDRHLQG